MQFAASQFTTKGEFVARDQSHSIAKAGALIKATLDAGDQFRR